MGELRLKVPDDLDVALNVQPGALPRELLFAAAVKLFGSLSRAPLGCGRYNSGPRLEAILGDLGRIGFRHRDRQPILWE